MTYAYKWREMDIEYPVPLKNGKTATVAGRLDMYDWKTKTIIDLKTTKFVKWQIKQGFLPKLEHILQVQCYDTMFSQIMPVENLNIVYVDMSDIVTYKVTKKDLTEWIKTRIQEIEEFIGQNKTPKGEATGLCQYCKYQTRCYNDGNGISEKPLSIPVKEGQN
jgi:CRISPR/Cas system-associated exonuclease Cas4 (RecB family)